MTDIPALLTAAGGLLLILGGGAKWLLSRMDAKNEAAALREGQARTELSERLQVEISHLREEVSELQKLNGLYRRRIFQLESVIHRQVGMDIPTMDGWPPA